MTAALPKVDPATKPILTTADLFPYEHLTVSRLRKKEHQRQMADRYDISQQFLSFMETGNRSIPWKIRMGELVPFILDPQEVCLVLRSRLMAYDDEYTWYRADVMKRGPCSSQAAYKYEDRDTPIKGKFWKYYDWIYHEALMRNLVGKDAKRYIAKLRVDQLYGEGKEDEDVN